MAPLDESTAAAAAAASAAAAPAVVATTTTTTVDAKSGDEAAAAKAAAAAAAASQVPVTSLAMKLLDVRLKPSGAIIESVIGEFLLPSSTSTSSTSLEAATGVQQICVAKAGGVLELYGIVTTTITTITEDDDGNEEAPAPPPSPRTLLKLLQRIETHSIVRSLATVRMTGEKRDLLAVTSDAGAWSLVDFSKQQGSTSSTSSTSSKFQSVVFGKTGCRRSTPGQYVASDPKGRAVLVSALEKRKLVYVLNHTGGGGGGGGAGTTSTTSTTTTNIASPLEAHRSRTLTFATVGVDNGYDNPIFATLEQQYPEQDYYYSEETTLINDEDEAQKQLAYYELDLGLNHVSRKWAMAVPNSACCLAALPGGSDGPSGVLVGSEDYVSYYHPDLPNDGHPIHCVVPRRKWETKRGILVTQLVVHRQKKGKFFAVAQTELGDVYKISMDLQENDSRATTVVVGIHMALLDTLPTANSMNISKKGLLFCAAEFGDHALYQFERIDLPNAPTNHSEQLGPSPPPLSELTTAKAVSVAQTFTPTMLQNLISIYTLDNPSPTTGLLVGELAGNEVSPQIYTLGGRGPCSSLRILRHGASVTELAVSELPGIPGGIFTIQEEAPSTNSKYIVVSFADATLVLSVGDTVEEVGRESGFLTNAPTLACSSLKGGSLCQIHPSGVRHIQRGQAKQWHCPGLKRIECASANTSQVLIALAGGEVTYFELDALSGNLTESATREMGADVCCIDAGTVAPGKSRSLFAAVGCRDQTVKIVSLEPGSKILQQKSSTALKSRPHSVSLQTPAGGAGSGSGGANDDLILMIGLEDGSSLRATVDPITGAIGTSPTRRFLGARPVSVSRIPLEQRSAMLLLSSRPWISRLDAASGKHIMAPLSYAPLDHGCAFSSDAVPEGVVATAGKTLRIISVDTGGMEGGEDEAFNTNRIPLRYTPRQMTLLSTAAGAVDAAATKRKVVLAVVESDYNDYGLEEKTSMGFDPTGGADKKKASKGGQKDSDAMDMDEDSDDEEKEDGKKKEEEEGDDDDDDEDEAEKAARQTPIRGPLPPESGHWGSCVRLLDPSQSCRTLDCIEMNRNEAALCCCSVRFHTRGGESLLAVGTVTGMSMNPLRHTASHVVLYRVVNGDRLQLLHRTNVDDGPVLALAHFQGRLLVGIGTTLRLYEMGKRQLLRKCELRGLPTFVKTIQTAGDRAFFGDMMRSLHMIRYEATSNRLVLVANDPSPRPIVCQELLDWNTVAVGDKFGNICVMRLPRGADTGALDLTGQRALWDTAKTDTTAKLEVLCQYYVGEIVTSMTRSSLVAGGAESLIYVTVTGRIGALVPFTSRDDVEFFTQLEGHLRTDAPRPTGRDPQAYRSYYAPVMHVVDGDLCDAFNALSHDEQIKIADRLDRTVGEIMKKLEDTRNSLL